MLNPSFKYQLKYVKYAVIITYCVVEKVVESGEADEVLRLMWLIWYDEISDIEEVDDEVDAWFGRSR